MVSPFSNYSASTLTCVDTHQTCYKAVINAKSPVGFCELETDESLYIVKSILHVHAVLVNCKLTKCSERPQQYTRYSTVLQSNVLEVLQ